MVLSKDSIIKKATSHGSRAGVFVAESTTEKNLDKIKWKYLCKNPAAIHLLEKNLNKIDWTQIVRNPNAVELISKNLDKLDGIAWENLQEIEHPLVMDILKENQDKIVWSVLSFNPFIFELDKQLMRDQCMEFAEELAAYVFHPERIIRFSNLGGLDFYDYMEIF